MGKKNREIRILQAIKPNPVKVRSFLCEALKTVSLVLFYYSFSISLTFYNKRFIQAFKFPLSITMVHLITKFVLSMIVRFFLVRCQKKERVTLAWGPYIKRVAPPGIFSSLDIGLSNWSFEFITISLYTMTKSTVIIFILFFSLIFRLEKPRISLVFVVLFIAGGLFRFTYESTQFNLLGFLLCLGASFLSGLRWTTSQMVMQKSELGLTNPLDMMYHIQPWMILALLPLSAGFEGLHIATSEFTFNAKEITSTVEHLSILFAGAMLAFGLEFSEFLLLSQTSSLTLSISGIIKEVVTLTLAALINGDVMTFHKILGLSICLLGISLHIALKTCKEQEKVEKPLDESVEMLLHNGNPAALEDDEEIEVFDARNHSKFR